MAPLSDRYFHSHGGIKLEDIYSDVTSTSLEQVTSLQEFVKNKFAYCTELSEKAMKKGATEEDRQFIELFSFICSLAFDAYVKRLMIEKLIDFLPEPETKKKR